MHELFVHSTVKIGQGRALLIKANAEAGRLFYNNNQLSEVQIVYPNRHDKMKMEEINLANYADILYNTVIATVLCVNN